MRVLIFLDLNVHWYSSLLRQVMVLGLLIAVKLECRAEDQRAQPRIFGEIFGVMEVNML